jgi:hypothetical protein
VHRAEDSINQGLFERLPQGVREGTLLEALSFSSESLGGIVPLKYSEGNGDQNHLVEVKLRRKDAKSFWPEVLEKSEQTVEFLSWGSVKFFWTIGSRRSMRRLRLNVFQCSEAQKE